MSGRDSVSSTPFISTSCLSFSSSWDHQTTCFGGGIQLLKKLNECNVTYTSYSLHTLHTLHTHFFIHTSDETWKCLEVGELCCPKYMYTCFACLWPAYYLLILLSIHKILEMEKKKRISLLTWENLNACSDAFNADPRWASMTTSAPTAQAVTPVHQYQKMGYEKGH